VRLSRAVKHSRTTPALSRLLSRPLVFAAVTDELWNDVDEFIAANLVPEPESLKAARHAGIPSGHVAANQGKLLELLARLQGARRILELGTLAGYSTIWLARALPPDGTILTLEIEQKFSDVAQANIARADLAASVEVRVGSALHTLAKLVDERVEPFDMIFIDADKQNNPAYLRWCLQLARPGTLIVADNVVRGGAILDPDAHDPRLGDGGIEALRDFYTLLGESNLDATAIQTVGEKGHDGFALAIVNGE